MASTGAPEGADDAAAGALQARAESDSAARARANPSRSALVCMRYCALEIAAKEEQGHAVAKVIRNAALLTKASRAEQGE